ncbi:DUF982 domain-containing protein [Mesorhizobium sp. M0894]|uniref:DUF982 domain-containing protein n=1 Tax=unclassified Mesorhizobium TaxID=325217 RepID=UPI00333CA141
MSSGTFSSPLFVRRAAYIVQEIAVLRMLSIFSTNGQKMAETEAALTACFDAYNGRIPASAARKTYFRFGEQVAIMEDATSAMQWLAACMSGSGKAQV